MSGASPLIPISQTAPSRREIAAVNANPLRYKGYYYDHETGYYYLQSRYYDPSICRFINSDIPEIAQDSKEIELGENLFAYCCNEPVNNSDPTGYKKQKLNITYITDSENVNNAIIVKKYYNKLLKRDYNVSDIVFIAKQNTFSSIWKNNLADIFVIISHGGNGSLSGIGITNKEIKNLKYSKRTKLVLIVCCQAACQKKPFSNCAYCFSTRINGCVFACSSNVKLIENIVGLYAYLKSTSKYKWFIYRKNVLYSTTFKQNVYFSSLMNYLKDRGFF